MSIGVTFNFKGLVVPISGAPPQPAIRYDRFTHADTTRHACTAHSDKHDKHSCL